MLTTTDTARSAGLRAAPPWGRLPVITAGAAVPPSGDGGRGRATGGSMRTAKAGLPTIGAPATGIALPTGFITALIRPLSHADPPGS